MRSSVVLGELSVVLLTVKVFDSCAHFGKDVNLFTPKGFHSKAQGQRRSRATLGLKATMIVYPEGVRPLGVQPLRGSCRWAMFPRVRDFVATLGFGM